MLMGARATRDRCHMRKQNPSPIGYSNSNAEEPCSYSTYWRPTFQQFLDIFGLYRSNYELAPSLPLFYSQSFKTIQTAPFLRARPPDAAHPHPDLFPGSETLASVPPLNPDIKRHQQDTTWLLRLKLAQWERDVFPHKQNSKSRVVLSKKNKQGFFSNGFSLLWLQKCSRFTSWLQTVNWRIDEKNRLSWSLFVSDVKKCDGFQFTSVVQMNNYRVWCWSILLILHNITLSDVSYMMFIWCVLSFIARLRPKLRCANCANWALITACIYKGPVTHNGHCRCANGQWEERINLLIAKSSQLTTA